MSRLDEIVAQKWREVESLKDRQSLDHLQRAAASAAKARSFRSALDRGRPAVIAEVKRASPSRGVLAGELDPAHLAQSYAGAGADAVSVLTDERFFRGSNADLLAVRSAVDVPVLRKDFIVDPTQIYEARALGADAVLLIVRLLDDRSLVAFLEGASSLGMDALVEVHTEEEARRAVDAGARIVGVNNRDLATFQVDLGVSERLRPLIPTGVTTVSESGVLVPDDALRMFRAGFDAVLVGEGLVTAREPGEALRRLKDHARTGTLR